MKFKEKGYAIDGKFDITVIDKYGNIKQHITNHNRVVDGGLELIASLIAGEDNDPQYISRPTYCAIGADNKSVESTDTALGNELYRKAFDTVVRTNNNVEFTTTFLPAEPDLQRCRVQEVALFNANDDGVMFNRCIFSQINKYVDDTLVIKYTLTINASESPYDNEWEDETPTP